VHASDARGVHPPQRQWQVNVTFFQQGFVSTGQWSGRPPPLQNLNGVDEKDPFGVEQKKICEIPSTTNKVISAYVDLP